MKSTIKIIICLSASVTLMISSFLLPDVIIGCRIGMVVAAFAILLYCRYSVNQWKSDDALRQKLRDLERLTAHIDALHTALDKAHALIQQLAAENEQLKQELQSTTKNNC